MSTLDSNLEHPGVGPDSIPELVVHTSSDKMEAVLEIPAGYPGLMLTEDLCSITFQERGILIGIEEQTHIHECLVQVRATPQQSHRIAIRGKNPIHGTDGFAELIHDGFSRDERHEAEVEGTDHYERNQFVSVKPGQPILRIVPPTSGEDGRNVEGKSLAARAGKELTLRMDDSVLVDASGSCIAQIAGIVDYDGERLRIVSKLEVPGNVDFKTGNIEVDCDVEIAGSVRDLFSVVTSKSITVRGCVEAATIHAGENFTACKGMAARQKGQIQVGRNVNAAILNNVSGRVGGNLVVNKELVNCTLEVGGSIDVSAGAVLASSIHALGKVVTAELGSASELSTKLFLGSSPKFESVIALGENHLAALAKKMEKCDRDLEALGIAQKRGTADQREAITEMMFAKSSIDEEIQLYESKMHQLRALYNSKKDARVIVKKMMYAGTELTVNGVTTKISENRKGPLLIGIGSDKKLEIKEMASDAHLAAESGSES